MAETSGLGGTYGGWTPRGTPHYSRYRSRGFYRSRAMPRKYAALYLIAAPVIGAASMTAVPYASRVAAKIAYSRHIAWSSKGAPGMLSRVISTTREMARGYGRAIVRGGKRVARAAPSTQRTTKKIRSASDHAQKWRDRQAERSRSDRRGSRRRYMSDEYAYKY